MTTQLWGTITMNYQAPKVTVIGSLEQLTAASRVGTQLDGNFSAGTPLSEVGLS